MKLWTLEPFKSEVKGRHSSDVQFQSPPVSGKTIDIRIRSKSSDRKNT